MARKQFTLQHEPHVAEVGDIELYFKPEIYGDEFLDAYSALQDTHRELGTDLNDLNSLSGDKLRALYGTMRTFLKELMTEESAKQFIRFEVVKAGKTVEAFGSREEAEEHAAGLKSGAKVVDKSMRLPDRILVQLLEWTIEIYGGSDSRPTGSSTASSPASRPAGIPGKGSSPSKGSTRARGR